MCPDEINHYPTSLNYRLARGAGKCFYMGGLAGIPFVGRVGYNAFTAHIPNDGNLVVLFAPHVGCTPEGDLGLFLRDGQSVYDNACKEAIAAYKWLQSNQWEPIHDKNAPVVVPKGTDPYQYQFVYIREALKPFFSEIEQAEEPMAELVYAMYEIAR